MAPPIPELTLAEVQRRFWTLVTAPEGVAQGLEFLGHSEEELAALVAGDERLSAVERLDIYANMYFFRIRDVIADDYRAVAGCVGEDDFHDLVVDYLAACPPAHPSIRHAGERFPAWLASAPIAEKRPWIAELAALEWTRRDLFDGPDCEAPLALDRLRGLSGDELVALPLRLVPSHAILRAAYAVAEAWDAVYEERPASAPEPRPQTILVWRRDLEVLHRVVDDTEAALLPLLARGERFGVLCDRLAGARPVEEASRIAFELLARWATGGLLASPA
jgi:hypothetical protein